MVRISAFATLLLVPVLALAQGGGLSPADYETFIKDGLKKKFEKQSNNQVHTYDIEDTPYFATLNTGGKFLMYYARIPAKGVELQKVNAWNVKAIYSRAYIDGDALVFEVPQNVAVSPSRELLLSYYDVLEKEFKNFTEFLGK